MIATYARQAQAAGVEVVVVSADKDLMQLIGPGISMRDPIKNRAIGPAEVMEKFGVPPEKVIEVQALAGDSTDNVPGVPGIGIRPPRNSSIFTAMWKPFWRAPGKSNSPSAAKTCKQHADMARISKQLVTLKADVPVSVPYSDLHWQVPDQETLLAFITAQNFKSLITKFTARTGGTSSNTNTPSGNTAPAVRPTADSPKPTGGGYETVQTVAALERWVKAATNNGWVAVDTETDGLDPVRARMVGISLSIESGSGCYIPLRHGGRGTEGTLDLANAAKDTPPQIPVKDAMRILKPMLEDPSVLKIGHKSSSTCTSSPAKAST